MTNVFDRTQSSAAQLSSIEFQLSFSLMQLFFCYMGRLDQWHQQVTLLGKDRVAVYIDCNSIKLSMMPASGRGSHRLLNETHQCQVESNSVQDPVVNSNNAQYSKTNIKQLR